MCMSNESDDERASSGQFVDVYPESAFLDALREEPVGTSEVAQAVGCTEKTAYNRLHELADAGMIDTRLVGHTRIWWLPTT